MVIKCHSTKELRFYFTDVSPTVRNSFTESSEELNPVSFYKRDNKSRDIPPESNSRPHRDSCIVRTKGEVRSKYLNI